MPTQTLENKNSKQQAAIEQHAVRRILETLEGVKGIYLYGSRAAGKARPDSDYDIAILGERLFDPQSDRFFKLQIELAGYTDSGVNISDLRRLPTVLQFEVLRQKKRLFVADRPFCIAFEAYILSSFQDFNPRRQPLIQTFIEKALKNVQQ